MRWLPFLLVALVAGCATESSARRVPWSDRAQVGCATPPMVPAPAGFHHLGSGIAAGLGHPRHRGIDLIAASEAAQIVEGDLAYTKLDKALEDEEVDLFACAGNAWRSLGTTRTDDEGHFALRVAPGARIADGLSELFVSVRGDRSGVAFTSYVAPAGTAVAVVDVDGTLTSSENAVVASVVLGTTAGARADAPAALRALSGHGYQIVYLTARPRAETELTRRWLAERGFPRGPMVLAEGITLPGAAALAHKARQLAWLRAAGFALAAGVGNRASDVEAYAGAGIAADRIFIELPEYRSEVAPLVAARRAMGFESYAALTRLLAP
jgi:phosphatidate phosphatase PAH1